MTLLSLIEYVKAEVDPAIYYAKLHGWQGGNLLCPFHDFTSDSNRSPTFSFNIESGKGYCHNPRCNKSIGSIVHMQMEWQKVSEVVAARQIYEHCVHPLIPAIEVNKFVKELTEFPFAQKQIEKQLGLTNETQNAFRLGFNPDNKRILFPIPTQFGIIGYFRAYKLPSDRIKGSTVPKIINAPKGAGRTELFPWNYIREFTSDKPVIFHKAERDTMLCHQMGFQCFCITGAGESASIDKWAALFKSFNVYIIPDQDEAGRTAADKRLKSLREVGCNANICELPTLESGKDFSDYILHNGGNAGTFQILLDKCAGGSPFTPKPKRQLILRSEAEPSTNGNGHVESNEIELVSLNKLDNIHARTVQSRAIIIGTMDERFKLPVKFSFHNGSEKPEHFDVPLSRELLNLMRKSDKNIAAFLKEEIVGKKAGEIKILEYVTATEVELAPTLDINNEQAYLSPKSAVILGPDFATNTPYLLTLNPTTLIDTQRSVSVIIKNEPLTDESTAPDFDEIKDLNIFRPKEETVESYEKQINKIANEVAAIYTRVYNRPDVHICNLLTWLSPLCFHFGSEGKIRGWINTLIMGDTNTGKSWIARGMQNLFGCGAFMSGENCTFVGLIGGAVRNSSDRFILRWGRIPINDRRLVVVEELSGLRVEEIARMSEVRSSGVARIDKGGITAETSSRTRLLCLSNVRGASKGIEAYTSGVEAVLELIGQPEDVSRFDLICTLADREVDASVINNADHEVPARPKFTADRFNKLARLIWSLSEEQINITDEALQACRDGAMELGQIYSPSIPIFKAASGRILLARVSCAIASLLYSFSEDDDAKTVELEVNEIHVQCAMNFLQVLYNKPSFGYGTYSSSSNMIPLTPEETQALWVKCKHLLGNSEDHINLFGHLMMTQSKMDFRMFNTISGFNNLLIQLTQHGICTADKGHFEITAKGRNFIRTIFGGKDKPKKK